MFVEWHMASIFAAERLDDINYVLEYTVAMSTWKHEYRSWRGVKYIDLSVACSTLVGWCAADHVELTT